jgi:signal transduction histidine kinase
MQGISTLPLLVDATDDELAWLIENSTEVKLDSGDFFFREGERSRQFAIVLDGELQISRTVDGQDVILGTTPRGVMSGELHLLAGTVPVISARAILPTRLMVFELPQFLGIFGQCPSLGLKIIQTAAERMHLRASLNNQRERMAALGKLAAGLAHELNNPAAAARRSSRTLREMLPDYQAQTLRLGSMGISDKHLQRLIAFMEDVRQRKEQLPPLATLDKSDREDEVCDWLDAQGVDDFWTLGSAFVDWHVTTDELHEILSWVDDEHAEGLLAWIRDSLSTIELLAEVEECTVRISDLVSAVKSYTYMDRGAYQEVDIARDLENTLMVLKHRLAGVTVERIYDEDVPKLVARGGALNQVWTNLIDNAVDAMNGKGMLKLITRRENDFVMVEVADDGVGVSDEAKEHLFEPFYTTKDIGSGTGLGLDIAYRVIQEHKGTIEFWSTPGNTRFIVRLPIRALDEVEESEVQEEVQEREGERAQLDGSD